MKTITPAEAKKILTNIPPGGKIELTTPEGIVIVSERTKDDILREKYPSLIGKPITTSEAAKKYNVLRGTIHKWRLKDDGYRMLLNEAEVAYCVDTYLEQKKNGTVRGVPLFDKNGLPYRLKHPKLSEYRQKVS
jgi:hypothetical protein